MLDLEVIMGEIPKESDGTATPAKEMNKYIRKVRNSYRRSGALGSSRGDRESQRRIASNF